MKFKTWLDSLSAKQDVIYTPEGSDVRNEWTRGKEEGVSVPIKKGSYSISEYVNSFREQTDLKTLVSNFTLVNGCSPFDYFLQQGKPIGDLPLQFGDITNIPDNRIDFVNEIKYGLNWFNSLPTEFREKFNNDIDTFLDKLGTAEFDNILQSFAEPVDSDPKVEPDVVVEKTIEKGGVNIG